MALKYLDTDGSRIEMAGERMYAKGEQPKAYQTPYGEVVGTIWHQKWMWR